MKAQGHRCKNTENLCLKQRIPEGIRKNDRFTTKALITIKHPKKNSHEIGCHESYHSRDPWR